AVEAIAARGLAGKIVVVGFDATREAVRAVQAGRLSAMLAGHPERMGRLAVEHAIKAALGEPLPVRVQIDTVIVTRENAADFLR
ncbi:MAG: sugar ABC transporter substrate-binding protein, partial [Bryobacteraceae bacterium]